jgi:hypothetical protein
MIKKDERKITELSTSAERSLKFKKQLTPLKYIAVACLMVLPYFEIPEWCVTRKLNTSDEHECLPEVYINSGIPKIRGSIVAVIYLVSYMVFLTFVITRLFYKKRTK